MTGVDSVSPANMSQDSVYHIKIFNGTDYQNPIEFDAAPVMLSNEQRAYSQPELHDLALLAIPPDVVLPSNVTGIRFRDVQANPLRVGEPVFAVGNPFGERDSIAFGIISHPKRKTPVSDRNFVQTDAQISPGNSGGGSFDMQGKLLGINSMGIGNGTGVAVFIGTDRIEKVFKEWGISLR